MVRDKKGARSSCSACSHEVFPARSSSYRITVRIFLSLFLSLRFSPQTRGKCKALLTLLILNFSGYIRQLCYSFSLQLLTVRLRTFVFLGTIVSAGVSRDGVWTRFSRCVSQSTLLDVCEGVPFSFYRPPVYSVALTCANDLVTRTMTAIEWPWACP